MKKEDNELTYGEYIEAKKNLIIDKYIENINEFIRNVKLNIEDLEDGILSETFFNRKDISMNKKILLLKLTRTAKEELEEVF